MAYENIRFSKPNMVVHDGYFYMMDEARSVLFQKLDDGETAFVYPLSIDLTKKVIRDAFDGDPGSELNPALWNSNTTINDNNVRITTNPGLYFHGEGKTTLVGNFDIGIDFNIIDGPSASGWQLALGAWYMSGGSVVYAIQILVVYTSAPYYIFQEWTGSWTNRATVARAQNKGRIRLVRTGTNTFTGYYLGSSGWVQIHSRNVTNSDLLWPYIAGGSWNSFPNAIIDVDNFEWVTNLNMPVQLEHDGINYWTLQNRSDSKGFVVRRWQTHNHVCDLHEEIDVIGDYDVNAFTVEHYHDTLASGVNTDDYTILLTDYTDTIVSGSQLTLGPDDTGLNYEDVDVIGVSGSNIILSSGVLYNYPENSNVNFYTNLWVFNSTGDGTLHKINARTGDVLDNYTSGTEYDNITACTFFKAAGVVNRPVDCLVYVKGVNVKYLKVSDMTTYGVMVIDNFIPPAETLVIYDMSLDGVNIYRLQLKARYFGTNHTWTTYNYVLATTRRFVDTINVSAYPIILPANAVNISKITAIVNDQYGDGVRDKPVYFTDDDAVGFITIDPAFTDNFFGTGAAVTYYKAGTAVRLVTIEGTATQFD
jgi:hypothetical protein